MSIILNSEVVRYSVVANVLIVYKNKLACYPLYGDCLLLGVSVNRGFTVLRF